MFKFYSKSLKGYGKKLPAYATYRRAVLTDKKTFTHRLRLRNLNLNPLPQACANKQHL